MTIDTNKPLPSSTNATSSTTTPQQSGKAPAPEANNEVAAGALSGQSLEVSKLTSDDVAAFNAGKTSSGASADPAGKTTEPDAAAASEREPSVGKKDNDDVLSEIIDEWYFDHGEDRHKELEKKIEDQKKSEDKEHVKKAGQGGDQGGGDGDEAAGTGGQITMPTSGMV